MPADRADEAAGRRIVAHALPGATVDLHDDGSRDRMVDAVISYPDGRRAALEFVSDTDPDWRRTWARIENSGGQIVDARDLEYTWHLNVGNDADIREIRDSVAAVLGMIEAKPMLTELDWPNGRRWSDAAMYGAAFRQLGVTRATPIESRGTPSKVIISPAPLAGWAGEPDALVDWAETFLASTPDVVRKLADSGEDEAHAFIWATITTPYQVTSVLDGDALPARAPSLPDSVTHLWIGGYYGGSRVVSWDAERGWIEAYRLPADGRIDIPA